MVGEITKEMGRECVCVESSTGLVRLATGATGGWLNRDTSALILLVKC